MEKNRIQIIKKFEENLRKSWENYRAAYNLQDNSTEFIIFLIDRQIIRSTTIRRYTIVKEFQAYYSQKQLSKTEVVKTLSKKYLISTRSIWNIIREYQDQFKEEEDSNQDSDH